MLLPKAPIHEAVLEIGVELPEAGRELLIGRLQEEFSELSKSRDVVQLQIDASASVAQAQRDITGVLLETADKGSIVHARLDGFAVSKLRPYSDWHEFCRAAMQLWDRYRRITRPIRCVRLGLRYINHLEIDLAVNISESLNISLNVPPFLAPVGMTEVMTMFTSEFPDAGATARVMLHIPPVQTHDTRVVAVLDIDVFRPIDIAPEGPALWREFERLRKVKNDVFFNSITEEARKRYGA